MSEAPRKLLVQFAIDEAIAKRTNLPSPSPGSTPAAQAPASAGSRGLFARLRAKFDPNWDPSEHPRDLNGRFMRATAAALLVTAAISGVQSTMQLAHDPSTTGHGDVPNLVVHAPDGPHLERPGGQRHTDGSSASSVTPDAPDDKKKPRGAHQEDEPSRRLPSTGDGVRAFDLHAIGDALPPEDLNRIKLVLQRGKDGAPAKVVRVIERQLATIQEMQTSAQAKPAPASDRGVNPSVSPRPGGKVQLSPALNAS